MTEIAQMLERARLEKGLSRNKAAAELGTSSTTYRQWMRGQQPHLARLLTFADFADETIEEIIKKAAKDAGDDANRADFIYISSDPACTQTDTCPLFTGEDGACLRGVDCLRYTAPVAAAA